MAYSVPFLMMGLIVPGVVFDTLIFPYIFIDESYGAIFNYYCVEVTYGKDSKAVAEAFRMLPEC